MNRYRDIPGLILALASAAAILTALGMVFLYAPREATMGDVQRIFYFHVSSAWVGFFAFFVTFLAGILYLIRGERRWDILALSSVEVGLTFITMAVITGSLWARPVWGTYWTWEPRLTISAVQLLIYIAYGMLRRAVEGPERQARFAAVYGIVAFVTVPLSWFAIRWWRTIHPEILSGGDMALTPRMVQTLMVSLGAFTLLYATLLRQRIRLERFADALALLKR
ncbi:MAG: cytochrome c biogenesis protein CcsA [Thermoflexales bacterium]|nr:cytochrome c biogenesis protein CcsA [Thermoflexales bacterium]